MPPWHHLQSFCLSGFFVRWRFLAASRFAAFSFGRAASLPSCENPTRTIIVRLQQKSRTGIGKQLQLPYNHAVGVALAGYARLPAAQKETFWMCTNARSFVVALKSPIDEAQTEIEIHRFLQGLAGSRKSIFSNPFRIV